MPYIANIRLFPKIGVPLNQSILMGFSILNHPFWGPTIFGNTHNIPFPPKKKKHLSFQSFSKFEVISKPAKSQERQLKIIFHAPGAGGVLFSQLVANDQEKKTSSEGYSCNKKTERFPKVERKTHSLHPSPQKLHP